VLPVLWYGQAVTAAAAIGAALLERAKSGLGQALTVSGLHGAATMALLARVPAVAPLGRTHPQGAAPNYRLYECSDGQWLFLGTLFEGFFATAMAAMGQSLAWAELELDPEGAREQLAAAFRARPRQAWLDRLMAAGVPCAPIESRETWFDSPVVAESGLRVTFEHPEHGAVAFPGAPIKLSATPASVRSLATPTDGPSWPPRAPAPTRPRRPGAGPLDGVRVLDLGAVVAGAHAGDILANLGADVIKVEPAAGDPFRSDGALFLAYNRGKRGLGVDLKQPAGLALFLDLARTSDVVLDNYRQGVRKRLGIDYPALRTINPRIISCSINAYGDAGPRAGLPGFDPLLQAESGMMAGQGGADAPVYYGVPVNDAATAATAAFGIVAALNAREATGEGQEVLTSLMAQSLMFQIGEMVTYDGRPPAPLGGRDSLGVGALHRFYACADGWLALVCETPQKALALGRALDVTIDDPAAALSAPRAGPLAETIAAALATRPRTEALDTLAAAGVPAAPVLAAIEAFQGGALRDEGVIEPWRHPRIGPVISARAYANLTATPASFRDPTPELGQHSRDLLAVLGLPPDRIAALFASGAVFEPAP
jgi:crotonobetainyl-CoA:carnitine CoA-transferase CaiB-like acyl-CoA transferase